MVGALSLCYTDSDVYESTLCIGKGVVVVWFWFLSSFPPLPGLFSFPLRTGWTGFELIPSMQPLLFCSLKSVFMAVMPKEVTKNPSLHTNAFQMVFTNTTYQTFTKQAYS